MTLKASRHPIQSTKTTKGLVAAILPSVPMEKTIPESVANRRGSNQRVRSFNVPMRLHAMPIPRRTRPRMPMPRDSDQENTKAPTIPAREKPVIMRLAPIRSRKTVMGICAKAKA